MFPIVRVTGSPYECGRQHGSLARERVHRSITAYAGLFRDVVGWDWQQATNSARRFVAPIREFDEQYVDELAGIADGAQVQRDDILAINLRTEILLSAQVQTALVTSTQTRTPAPDATPAPTPGPGAAPARRTTPTATPAPGPASAPGECTAFACVTSDGGVVAAQNWDWMPFARDTVVVLRSQPDEGPAFNTVVEAGLLAKFGVNSAGVAVLTNALACDEDHGEPGVPYHVLLRALLSCTSSAEGVGVLEKAKRASSANYLLADATGDIVDLEARPGGPDSLHAFRPDARGVLVHTNHFMSPDFDGVDYADLGESTSHYRFRRARELISELTDSAAPANRVPSDQAKGSPLAAVLSDHAEAPGSICRHPIRSLPMIDQVETVASAVISLARRTMLLSEGPPCQRGYEQLSDPAVERSSSSAGRS